MVSREGLESVAKTVRDYLAMGSGETFRKEVNLQDVDFIPLYPDPIPGRILAVDGSNAVIFDWSVARANQIRAGYVVYEGWAWQKTVVTYDDIFLADVKSYRDQFLRYLKKFFGIGHFALEETELERLSSYFRELQEYIALQRAMKEAKPGDLLLYDGGFAFWKDRPFGDVVNRIFQEVKDRSLDLMGVSKSSSLSWGQEISRPFLQHLNLLGEDLLPHSAWYVDLWGKRLHPDPEAGGWPGHIYAVCFHPHAPRTFRVDVPDPVLPRIGQVMARVAGHSCSAECLGYPHALFRAHHELKISQDESDLVRLRLLDSISRLGLREREFRSSLDYHEVLEMALRR